jgi:hypothetical protein
VGHSHQADHPQEGHRSTVNISINHSKVVITKLHLDKDHMSLLDRKAKGYATVDNDKGYKFTADNITQTVDEFSETVLLGL